MKKVNTTPIIFLAFANDRQADGVYLRNLGQEAEQLREALTTAVQKGLCQVEVLTSASAESILKRFNDPVFKGRIALFHYAGHADDYDLLLESASGERSIADARGLAAFLRQQTGLHLVFLNACSTRAQVEGLLDAGISAVIATSRAVDDKVATDFSRHFYTALAGGDSIRTAFEKAQAALQFVRGDISRHLRLVPDPAAEHASAGWPWKLYLRAGAEESDSWDLPSAAGDPLFGLPPLPEMDLPAKPFRDLSWFRRADAPIFFGRGQQIRALYTTVTDGKAAPIVLFYGQSGVGKSSLLDAGLLPRLEQVQVVRYLRRDQEKGLLGTLLAHIPAISANSGNVGDAWRATEQQATQPLTLILDQVEEHFTRPNPALPDEMEQFLGALVAIFADRAQRPQGKLILSFRKEWLAEIEKRLVECELPVSKVFLERLDEPGVIEAVSGVAETPNLQQHYQLTIEAGLDQEIATDLLKDREAAVAPMLQILLTRLWEEATQRQRANPRFDRALYDQLRRDGLKLDQFLDRQLAELQKQQPEVVDSGLALDLLSFHTTPLGTAEQHDFAALEKAYQHHSTILPNLVRTLQNLYLLVDPAADQTDSAQKSRLAHDTLAPLVRARFDESIAPGQRARRIVETRAVDWEGGKTGAPLDEMDLTLVETGMLGMRSLKDDEERILEVSRKERVRREEERIKTERQKVALERSSRRRMQAIIGILTVLSCVLLSLLLRPYFLSWLVRGEMVLIPATTTALIGTDERNTNEFEQPQIEMELASYSLEKYEVTNEQFGYCVSVSVCSEPRNPHFLEDERYHNHPVTGVTAIQAARYCRWIGRRLPTELEWEHAARGVPDKKWPWGDEPPTMTRVNMPLIDGKPLTSTVPVTDFAAGASQQYGIFHLVGNAREWTSSTLQEYREYDPDMIWNGSADSLKPDQSFVVRGGDHNQAIKKITQRSIIRAVDTLDALGFRCAIDG